MTPFLLILGPSGVGKSSVIRELCRDSLFGYVQPVTNRPLREGETDKFHVPSEKLDQMEHEGRFVVVNELYGFRYGTPRGTIDALTREGRVPILDWPIQMLPLLTPEYGSRLLRVYLIPPSTDALVERLGNRILEGNSRLSRGLAELDAVASGTYADSIDALITSEDHQETAAARQIADIVKGSLPLSKFGS